MSRKAIFFLGLLMSLGMFIGPVFAQLLDKGSPPESKKAVLEEREKFEDNQLMDLNYVDVDIRNALSALAMEREINIATRKRPRTGCVSTADVVRGGVSPGKNSGVKMPAAWTVMTVLTMTMETRWCATPTSATTAATASPRHLPRLKVTAARTPAALMRMNIVQREMHTRARVRMRWDCQSR